MSNKTILVTGGAGYIGSILCRKLLQKYNVIVFDNFYFGDQGVSDLYIKDNFTLIKGDITNRNDLINLFKNKIDCVIHLAAISNDPSASLNNEITKKTNLDTYIPILELCIKHNVKRFINSSSIGVYGINYDNNVSEEDPVNPITEYAKCKVKSEQIVQSYASVNFTTTSLRCGTVCGWSPRMRFDLSVNTLTGVAIQNNRLTVWGGEQRRPQIYILDIANFFLSLIEIESEKINGKIFNAAGHNYKVIEIAELIKEVLGNNLKLISAPARDDERTYHVNSDYIKDKLGLEPTYTVRDAINSIKMAKEEGKWDNYAAPEYNNVKMIMGT